MNHIAFINLNCYCMKQMLLFMSIVVGSLFSTVSYAQTLNISKGDALAIAQKQFEGKDVDYYILSKVTMSGSNISQGVYVVCYVVNSVIIDQYKIRIE